MPITFDPAKSEWNRRECGMPFTMAERFDFDTALVREDQRENDPEPRFQAPRQDRPHRCVLGLCPDLGRLPCDLPPEGDEAGANLMAGKTSVTFEDDVPELTAEQLDEMRPAREVMSPEQFAAVASVRRGRPKAKTPKVPVTIRLDPEVVETYKATGDGWQTRMNDCLCRGAQELRAGRPMGSGAAGPGRLVPAGRKAKAG